MDIKGERNYGIDTLRLLLMYMVCMLHTLGDWGVLNACQIGTFSYKAFWLIEILAYCAVDGFGIISGYVLTEKPCKYEKIVEMWFQVLFYSLIVTLLFTMAGSNSSWNRNDIIRDMFPVTYGVFWYFTAYIVLFFATPILNKFILSVDENTAKKGFIILVVLFSGIGFVTDAFKVQGGYSALWLMVLYCVGGFAKKGNIFKRKSSRSLVIVWLISSILTWYEYIFMRGKLLSYVSPTIVLNGLVMVILFSRIQIKGTLVKKLSPLAFGIYLFHQNKVINNNYIQDVLAFVVKKNIYIGIIYVVLYAALIFFAGLIVEFGRNKLSKVIKIPELSRKIVKSVRKIGGEVVAFLN